MTHASTRAVPASRVWLLGLGYGVWCLALSIMYALHAVGCVFGWPVSALRIGLGVTLAIHLGVLAWAWRDYARTSADPAQGDTGAFLHWVILWTLITAFVATVLVLGPALFLTSCL